MVRLLFAVISWAVGQAGLVNLRAGGVAREALALQGTCGQGRNSPCINEMQDLLPFREVSTAPPLGGCHESRNAPFSGPGAMEMRAGWAGRPCSGRGVICLVRNTYVSWPCSFCTDMDTLMRFKRSFTNGEEVLAEWSPSGNPCEWDGVICYISTAVLQL